MKRMLLSSVVIVGISLAACGGGDKKAPATDTPRAVAATATPGAAAKTPTAVPKAASPAAKSTIASTTKKSSDLVGGLFGSVFSNAFDQSGGAPSGLGAGDESLKQYLPTNGDLPDGYRPMGQYTFRAPDGISDTGGIDIAMEVASKGDATSAADLTSMSTLMAMVMKPDDLQSLGEAFSQFKDLNKQDLEDALTQGATGGAAGLVTIKDVRVLDAEGLGEGGFGFQMTMGLGGLSSILGAFGEDATPEPGAPDLSKLSITVRMYLFSRGDYVGGIMRMAFADDLADDVDEIALAQIIDGNLKSAP